MKTTAIILLLLTTPCAFAADKKPDAAPEKIDLAGAEAIALHYAPQIAGAYFRAEASREVVRETRSALFPQVLGIVDEAQTILKGGGVPELNASTVGADLKAIVTELQKAKSIVY